MQLSHLISNSVHWIVIFQQPVVISSVYITKEDTNPDLTHPIKPIIIIKQSAISTRAVYSSSNTRCVTTCVPDDVIEDNEPLKLQLELAVGVLRQRLCFKPPQPEICIFVSINEELEGANLLAEKQKSQLMCALDFYLNHHIKSSKD